MMLTRTFLVLLSHALQRSEHPSEPISISQIAQSSLAAMGSELYILHFTNPNSKEVGML